jgi:hypothetical protein
VNCIKYLKKNVKAQEIEEEGTLYGPVLADSKARTL